MTLNINSVADLIGYVKSKPPGSVNFASSGLGTVHQLNMELLMRKAGISDYEAFARRVLAAIPDRPVSFEVFADELGEMEQQARRIATTSAWAVGSCVEVTWFQPRPTT